MPPRTAAPPRPVPVAPGRRHRPDIQGLRAVAVLLVVASHAGVPGLAGGYVGVDVFFVISGFLITGLLLRENATTGKVSIARFFARRAIRLLPLSTLVASLTLVAAWRWLPPARIAGLGADALGAASYSINIRLAQVATDYFATTDPSPFQHYWSLAVEEQFYLLWPLLLLAAVRIGALRFRPFPIAATRIGTVRIGAFPIAATRIGTARIGAFPIAGTRIGTVRIGAFPIGGTRIGTVRIGAFPIAGTRIGTVRIGAFPIGGRRAFAVVVSVLCCASFVYSVVSSAHNAPWAYFGSPSRAWELGAGALLALAEAAHQKRSETAGPNHFRRGVFGSVLVSRLGLAAILAAGLLYDDQTPFPGFAALLPVLGAAAVIAGGRLRYVPPFPLIGELSYGWYLWHWPLLVIVPALVGHPLTFALRIALCAVALALAYLTYHFVENPIRHRRALLRRPHRGLLLGLGLSVLTGATATVAIHHPRSLALGAAAVDTSGAIHAAPATQAPAALTRLIAAAQTTDLIPANLRPTLNGAGADESLPQRDGCHLTLVSGVRPGECVYGPAGATRTVVLLGDSHALQWFPALDAIASDAGWRLISYTRSSCSPAPVAVRNSKLQRRYTECDAWQQWVSQRIDQLRPDLVVVTSSTNYLGMLADHPADPLAEWSAAWDGLFARLRADARQVAVLTDTPTLTTDPVDCIARHSTAIRDCAEPAGTVLRDQDARAAIRAAATRSGATVIDPIPWLCSDRCPLIVGDLLVYRDTNHMTTAYAQSLAPLLRAALPRLP